MNTQSIEARLNAVMNDGMLSVLIGIGYELGLFEAMSGLAPSRSESIAEVAGLNERYVREWLNAMVAGGIVEYAPNDATYHLPVEHADVLTSAAGPGNMAAYIHTISLLCDVRRDVMQPFRNGGGVPYERYDEFLALWAGMNQMKFERSLLEQVPQVLPEIAQRLDDGIDVLEIGCGEGNSTLVMARAHPNSRFTGYDLRPDAVEGARLRAAEEGLTNIAFEVRDLVSMNARAAYDLVCAFDVIHDQAKPRVVLDKVAKSLRAEGAFLMVDIHASSDPHENRDHPAGSFLYGTSLLHCMTVSLAYDGEGLGAMWGQEKARELLAEAGFERVSVHQVESDAFNDFFVARV
jgi:2-polyprenyl-3-methyl-5-hydroxy-6-metoxy-1,4-benzoquinol methylase